MSLYNCLNLLLKLIVAMIITCMMRVTRAFAYGIPTRGTNGIRNLGSPSRNVHWSQVFLTGKKDCEAPKQKLVLSEEEWRRRLTPEQFYVCRQKGTEPPFTGEYNFNHQAGIYNCACCGAPLFSSKTKFDSGSGWPSFFDVLNKGDNSESNVVALEDRTHGMVRIEVLCKQCDCHLGHVFEDGPRPTGLRYCINSASLEFEAKKVNPNS